MAIVFFLTFFVGDMVQDSFQGSIDALSAMAEGGLTSLGADDMLISLVCDGIMPASAGF